MKSEVQSKRARTRSHETLAAFEAQVQGPALESGLLWYVVTLADRRSIVAGAAAGGFVAAVIVVLDFGVHPVLTGHGR
jgi:hypothetical protein